MRSSKKLILVGVAVGAYGVGLVSSLAADLPLKAAAIQSIDQLWNISYNSEVRYFSWNNTLGFPIGQTPGLAGHGSQVYAPMSLSLTGNPNPNWKLEFVLRGGFVSATQTTVGEHGSVNTAVDTQLSGTATYNGFTGFQPFAALLINAPTGSSALYGSSRFGRMDGDLVDQGTYGEGWNFGPTAGVNIPLSQTTILTLSGGYTARGAFNKETTDPVTGLITATDQVKNGDEATVTAALGYSKGPLSLQGSGSYSWDQMSQEDFRGGNSFNQYRVGPRTTISGSASYAINDMWSVYGNGFWTHTEKNQVLDATATFLMTEPFNSNSNLFRINTGANYRFANGLTVGPTASYLYRDHDGYDPTSGGFVPAKSRWAFGGTANYNVTNKVNINARVERVWIREDEHLLAPPNAAFSLPVLSGDAWVVAGGATVNF